MLGCIVETISRDVPAVLVAEARVGFSEIFGAERLEKTLTL